MLNFFDRSFSGETYFTFKPIPYAEPPVGELRFRRPVPHKGWGDEVLFSEKQFPQCIQVRRILIVTEAFLNMGGF